MQFPRFEKYTPEEFEGVKSSMPVLHIMQFELFSAAAEEFHDQEWHGVVMRQR
jgi:hypothetical protein